MSDGPRDAQRSDDERPVFKRLIGLLRPDKALVGGGLALLLAAVPMELVQGAAALYIVDDLITPFLTDAAPGAAHPWLHWPISLGGRLSSWQALLASVTLWVLAIALVKTVLRAGATNLMERAAQRLVYRLRNRLYGKLQDQTLGYLYRQRTGDLMSRTVGDVDQVQQFIVNGIDQVLAEGLIWLATVVVVCFIDWRVALFTLTPILLVYTLLRIFNKRAAPLYKATRDSAGRVSSRLQENLGGLVTIKIFNREPAEADRFERETRDNLDDNVRAINFRTIYFPTTGFLAEFAGAAMYASGAYFILTGSFTVGGLLAFRAYYWRLFGPIFTLARVNDMVQRASAAARRVFAVLDEPIELDDPPKQAFTPTQTRGHLRLEGVTFAYRNKPEPVLTNVTLDIPAGKTVALCGPSGAGKSTVLSLLLRFYDPTDGRVLLDGHDVRSLPRGELRKHMALVQQETFLFAETIADNIRYGRPEATQTEIEEAARHANIHDFIAGLPGGYETTVGERGVLLSGGQKQRISLARAFLADPPILLLDEPTSSVEPASEAAILRSVLDLVRGRTTVLTSHRPSLIAAADLAYVLDGGGLAASGTPAQLRQTNDWFAAFMSNPADAA